MRVFLAKSCFNKSLRFSSNKFCLTDILCCWETFICIFLLNTDVIKVDYRTILKLHACCLLPLGWDIYWEPGTQFLISQEILKKKLIFGTFITNYTTFWDEIYYIGSHKAKMLSHPGWLFHLIYQLISSFFTSGGRKNNYLYQ